MAETGFSVSFRRFPGFSWQADLGSDSHPPARPEGFGFVSLHRAHRLGQYPDFGFADSGLVSERLIVSDLFSKRVE